ncbi:hypothetical protein B0H16DRAFT_1464148 [Mycena metata]|uniref:Uncharacterized protein n=1 Tax=Mycena metata TaxID=1033252 RepID=A0AAD7N233_9AGAR|nr:hypothetical protein B0H16DRAFT_1464148 [Mycena metata]
MAPSKNFSITEWILTADCDGPLGTCSRGMPLQDCLGCNRDGYLGTTNQVGYDFTRINTSWVSPTVDADGATMRWYNATFKVSTAVDLTTLFDNVDGNLCLYPKVPAVLYLKPGSEGETEFLKGLEASTKMGTVKDSLFQTSVTYDPADPGKENYTLFYAKASVEAEGQFSIKTYNNEAKVAVMNIFQKNGIRAEQVDTDIIQAKVSGQFGTYIGVNAALNLVSGQAGPFDVTLGVGVATGLGVRDEAIEVMALGCGFTIGKRVGISVAGTSAEINFGRFFPDQE